MSKLKKNQLHEINNLLANKGLINYINEYLTANNLADFEVSNLKIEQKNNTKNYLNCGPGYKKVEVCTINGKCTYKCMPL